MKDTVITSKKNENDVTLLKDLTPFDDKDAYIILDQYCISKDDVCKEIDKQVLFDEIGKLAIQERCKRKYICDYSEIVNNLYGSIDFVDMFKSIMDTVGCDESKSYEAVREAGEITSDFLNAFRYYTDYRRDCVNVHRYKRYMTNGRSYPELIYDKLKKDDDISVYTYLKFEILERRVLKDNIS